MPGDDIVTTQSNDQRVYMRHDRGSNRYVGGSEEHECCEHRKDEDECWEIKAKICFPEHDDKEPGVRVKREDDENCIKIEAEIRHGECREHKEHDEEGPRVMSWNREDECCEEHEKKHDKDDCWKIKAKICFPEMRVLLGGLGGIIRGADVSLEKNTDKREDKHDEHCIKIEAEVKHKKRCEHEHEDDD